MIFIYKCKFGYILIFCKQYFYIIILFIAKLKISWRMNLNKKIINIMIWLTIIFIVFSGCLNKSESIENSDLTNNVPPMAKITAPYEAYFGENIEFDASNSYDVDGKITSYTWDFGDGENIKGSKITHSYKFENNFLIEYPLIYPVTLFIKDNKGTLIATTHQIKIYPKEYRFYLNFNGLTAEKPSFSKDKINFFIYRLENPIIINKCTWSTTLYLEKPLFVLIKKLTLTLYTSDGKVITNLDEKLGIGIFWKEKIVKLNREIKEEVEFESLKIEIHSFFLAPKINIIYGGEKASNICFDFSN